MLCMTYPATGVNPTIWGFYSRIARHKNATRSWLYSVQLPGTYTLHGATRRNKRESINQVYIYIYKS